MAFAYRALPPSVRLSFACASLHDFVGTISILIQSALPNLLVCRAFRDFGNGRHIMARFARSLDDGPVQLSSARKFMLQDLSGIGASGTRA
jgi:hypothetical protein